MQVIAFDAPGFAALLADPSSPGSCGGTSWPASAPRYRDLDRRHRRPTRSPTGGTSHEHDDRQRRSPSSAGRPGRRPSSSASCCPWAAVTGIAAASIPSTGGVIKGCYDPRSAYVRVVDPALGQACNSAERALDWNQTGPRVRPACRSRLVGHAGSGRRPGRPAGSRRPRRRLQHRPAHRGVLGHVRRQVLRHLPRGVGRLPGGDDAGRGRLRGGDRAATATAGGTPSRSSAAARSPATTTGSPASTSSPSRSRTSRRTRSACPSSAEQHRWTRARASARALVRSRLLGARGGLADGSLG